MYLQVKPNLVTRAISAALFSSTTLSLLTACGGGNFGTIQTEENLSQIKPVNESKKASDPISPTPDKSPENDKVLEAGSGFILRGAMREDHQDRVPLSQDDFTMLSDSLILPSDGLIKRDSIDSNYVTLAGLGNLTNLKTCDTKTGKCADFSHITKQNGDYKYVRFGHFIDKLHTLNGKPLPAVSTFYHGDNPSKSIPISNIITYQGHWLYMSDANRKKATRDDSISLDNNSDKLKYDLTEFSDTLGNANSASATQTARNSDISPANIESRYENLPAHFIVNFADKTLKGTLAYENSYSKNHATIEILESDDEATKKKKISEMKQPYTPIYEVNADIRNNRFTGKAKSLVKSDGNRSVEHYGTNYNISDTRVDKALFVNSGSLEGGFYGEGAAELAGRFITDNADLMGVFGAKKNSTKTENTTLFDAKSLNHSIDRVVKNTDLVDVTKEVDANLPKTLDEFMEDEQLKTLLKKNAQDLWQHINGDELEELRLDDENLKSYQTAIEEYSDKYKEIFDEFNEKFHDIKVSRPLFIVLPESIGEIIGDDDIDIADLLRTQAPELWEKFEKAIPDFSQKLAEFYELEESESEELERAYQDVRKAYNESVRGEILTLVKTKELVSFGDIKQLHYQGQVLNLADISTTDGASKPNKYRTLNLDKDNKHYVTVCCDDLQSIAFGEFKINDMSSREYFVQGARSKTIPQHGKVRYEGSWKGFIEHSRPRKEGDSTYTSGRSIKHIFASNSASSKADFEVDFSTKKLSGQLNSDAQKVFEITADIHGTGFKGLAKTEEKGFTFNHQSTGAKETINITNGVVSGGFYGENAAELGGILHYNNNDGSLKYFDEANTRAGAVFGAKQIKE